MLKPVKASWNELNANAYLDFAEVYLECGDAQTAREWLEKIGNDDAFHFSRRDEMLLTVFQPRACRSARGRILQHAAASG